MSSRAEPMVPARASARPAAARRQHDDQWNQAMLSLLRSGARTREDRERARAREDEALARRQAAAILASIRTHSLPTARHHVLRPTRRGSPGSIEVPR